MNNLILALIAVVFAVVLVFAGVNYLERSSATKVTVATNSVADVEQMVNDYQNLRINLGRRPTGSDYVSVYGNSASPTTGQSPNSSYNFSTDTSNNTVAVRPSSLMGAAGWTYSPGCGSGLATDCFFLGINTTSMPNAEANIAYQSAQLAAKKEVNGVDSSGNPISMVGLVQGSCTTTAGCSATPNTNPAAWPTTTPGAYFLQVQLSPAAAAVCTTGCVYGDQPEACGHPFTETTDTNQPCVNGTDPGSGFGYVGTEYGVTTAPYICAGDNNPLPNGTPSTSWNTSTCLLLTGVPTGGCDCATGNQALNPYICQDPYGNPYPPALCNPPTTSSACVNALTSCCPANPQYGSYTYSPGPTCTLTCIGGYTPYMGACDLNCPANTSSTSYGAEPTCTPTCNLGYTFDGGGVCQPNAACGSGLIGACTVGTETAPSSPGPGNTEIWTCTASNNNTTSPTCSYTCGLNTTAYGSVCANNCPTNTSTVGYGSFPSCTPYCLNSAPSNVAGTLSLATDPMPCKAICPGGYSYNSTYNSCYENGVVNATTNGGYFSTTPSAGILCTAGSPGTVNFASNQYSWTCSGIGNGAASANGTAYQYYTESCETAGIGNNGGGDTVYYTTPSNWVNATGCCKPGMISSDTYADGGLAIPGCDTPAQCGADNGVNDAVAPWTNEYSGLCSVGGAGDGGLSSNTWYWSCNQDGVKAWCSAPEIVNGACGSACGVATTTTPSSNLCSTGNASGVSLGGTTYSWTCDGINGGIPAPGSAPEIVNGACGSACGVATATPPSSGLCSAGTPGPVSLSGNTYSWTCAGINGGSPAGGSAPEKVDAACGTDENANYTTYPWVADHAHLCANDLAGTTAYNGGGPSSGVYTWDCAGINGGNSASCQACASGYNWNGSACVATPGQCPGSGVQSTIANLVYYLPPFSPISNPIPEGTNSSTYYVGRGADLTTMPAALVNPTIAMANTCVSGNVISSYSNEIGNTAGAETALGYNWGCQAVDGSITVCSMGYRCWYGTDDCQ